MAPSVSFDVIAVAIAQGRIFGDAYYHACIFRGLRPGFAWLTSINSNVYAADRGIAVGDITTQGHAVAWHGTFQRDLHPFGATQSIALGISGTTIVGEVSFTGNYPHAAKWAGELSQWSDISPPGAVRASAADIEADEIVGWYALTDMWTHAVLWRNRGAAFVDLGLGYAYAAARGIQAGNSFSTEGDRATLWRGSAASITILHPPMMSESHVFGADGDYQVGTTFPFFPLTSHAAVWNGTAESWEDLHLTLPSNYSSSTAYAVEVLNGRVTVVGTAFNESTRRYQAIAWTKSR